jgi:integrase
MGESSFGTDRSSAEEGAKGESIYHSSASNLDDGNLVPIDDVTIDLASSSSSSESTDLSDGTKSTKPSADQPTLEVDRMQYIRGLKKNSDLSARATEFLAASSATNDTLRVYKYGWKQFATWFNDQNFGDCVVSPTRVVNFLTVMFDRGYSYSFLNNVRTSISMTAPTWNGIALGKTDLVMACLHKIDKERPALPAYESAWSLDAIVDWIEALGPNSKLSMKLLRAKCIMLFKLITMARSADILAISWKTVKCQDSKLTGFYKRLKNYRRDVSREFSLQKWDEYENLCVVRAWEEYLDRTKNIHRRNDRVFVGLQRPFKEITRETIAKTTLEAMANAGIDTSIFKSHSTRMAAATRALDNGATVDEVMRTGRWRSRSVFERFYNRAKAVDLKQQILKPGLQSLH